MHFLTPPIARQFEWARIEIRLIKTRDASQEIIALKNLFEQRFFSSTIITQKWSIQRKTKKMSRPTAIETIPGSKNGDQS